MYDKIFSVFALLLFIAFLGVLAVAVRGWDIKIVLIVTALMATYDFWLDAFRKPRNGSHHDSKS